MRRRPPRKRRRLILVLAEAWQRRVALIDDLITHKLALDEINKGFDLMHAGESIRSVVLY